MINIRIETEEHCKEYEFDINGDIKYTNLYQAHKETDRILSEIKDGLEILVRSELS